MKYLGGKSRIAPWLVAAIRPHLRGRAFWDPFCGGLSVARALSAVAGGGLVSDANPALIALYKAVAGGWQPPSSATETEYHAAKALPDSNPLKAYIGFGSSFGAKWFGGYARSTNARGDPRNYLLETRNGLLDEVGELVSRGCEFACLNFLAIEPRPVTMVLYLDPPYAGTEPYGALPAFDHALFIRRVAEWSKYTDVFISEYEMPIGRCVLEFGHALQIAGGQRPNERTERLYHLALGSCECIPIAPCLPQTRTLRLLDAE